MWGFFMKTLNQCIMFLAVAGLVVACKSGNKTDLSVDYGDYSPANSSRLQFNLTDKPSDEVQAVNVNIEKVELFLSKGSDQHRLVLAENVGFVDLLTLRNGVLMGLGNLNLPVGITIHQMRFVLGDGNNLIRNDGSLCEMKTPSAQQSGVKILFKPSLTTESNTAYSITLDFDVDDSIVLTGN